MLLKDLHFKTELNLGLSFKVVYISKTNKT